MTEPLIGVNVSISAANGADPVADAAMAEGLGFDFVSINDHLHGSSPTFETWTLLSWLAAGTSRIRVATRVLGVPYRHPAVVGKMAETLQRLSGGRLILGLGGGAFDDEFRGFGLGVRSPRDKVDGMEEAIRIMRGLWSETEFTFQGRLYRTEGARLEPKPSRPIPIWLGSYGPRALAVTGRLADGWIPTFELAPPERVTVMRDRVLEAAREAGRDPEGITCVYNLDIRVGEDTAEPTVVSGSPQVLVERLTGFLELGFSALNLIPWGPDHTEQMERLGREVIPGVRAAA
jgi:alkanesulfonate monooxygenase SsuD/methylene tetrahydromethanopterin reductase-like flavin-dependent oxidoreductase (luciferase family)